MLIGRAGLLTGPAFLPNEKTSKWLWALPLVFFGALFYWPLTKLLSFAANAQIFTSVFSGATLRIAWLTTWQAALSTLIALVISLPSAYLLYQRRFAGQRFISTVIALPFVLPTIIVAIGIFSLRSNSAITWLTGYSSIALIIYANIFMNFGLAVRIIGSNWTNLDRSLSDASQLDGAGKLREFWEISLPQLVPSIASAGALIFLYCATNFGIALLLGGGRIKTLETEIYLASTQSLDLSRAASLVLVQTVLTILVFMLSRRLSASGKFFVQSHGERSKRLSLGDLRLQLTTFPIIGILIVLPIFSVLRNSFHSPSGWGLDNFRNLAGLGARDLLSISVSDAAFNSLRNALLVMVLSISLGLVISRLNHAGSKFLITLFQLPIGISTVALGLGYLTTFGSGLFPLRSSWLVVPIAQTLMATPLVVRILIPALDGIGEGIISSAKIDRASHSQIWWRIQIPIIKPIILLAAGYAAVISLGDFAAANFLAYGDQATLPTVLFQLISRPGAQNYGMAMAASAVFVLVVGTVIFATEKSESQ